MEKGFLYLIQSTNCVRPYLGSTLCVYKRIIQHNNGETSATEGKGPWKLVRFWEFDSIEEARAIEYRVKQMKRKLILEQIDYVIKNYKKYKIYG
jgi:predicted GIY-YIG superfamily endonuclease